MLRKIEDILVKLRSRLEGVQDVLSFKVWKDNPAFGPKMGIGRIATISMILSLILGFMSMLWVNISLDLTDTSSFFLTPLIGRDRLFLLWQWCTYVMGLCSFHLLEFFITVLYNRTEASAESFLVNHSTGYTAAALTSWTEFGIRFCLFPRFYSKPVALLGLTILVAAQTIRSLAMATAGESFNHLIQTKKKDNHVLITHGIYSIFRHPSYVGFFYWSISTQLLLGNPLHTLAFSVVSHGFFKRRIAYEEESLCKLFPEEYPEFVKRTYMGIPFLKSQEYS